MSTHTFILGLLRTVTYLTAALPLSVVLAGPLEMPDTKDAPESERESPLKDLDIPRVGARHPDPMAGPRLHVRELQVEGIVEYPELGITRESLKVLIERIRFERMGEGGLLDSEDTVQEVGEISDLMAQIVNEKEGSNVVSSDVQRLTFLIREQRQVKGVTVGMIERVADTITRYYRERGFILAKAYIPEQRVHDGVVTLVLLLGELGEVEIQNNKKYNKSAIKDIFAPVLNEPVMAGKIEERLLFVNDLPGLNAQAYFEPGTEVGDTRLKINVLTERRFAGNMRIDNHGSASTGEFRLYTDGYWHNPLGFGDQLHIGVLGTFEPSNSLYGSIRYSAPVFNPRVQFTVGGSTNDFVSEALDGLKITGDSLLMDASLSYVLTRSRVQNYSVEVRLSEIDTDINNIIQGQFSDTSTDYDVISRSLGLAFHFDVLQEKIRALHQGRVEFTYGEILEGQRVGQSENPLLFKVDYSVLTFFQLPLSDIQNRLIFRLTGQYADGALPSVNQFSLTGPSRLRGFEVNTYNADHGGVLGIDWIMNVPEFLNFGLAGQELKNLAQPYAFADAGYGVTEVVGGVDADAIREGTENTWTRLANLGLGLKFGYSNRFRGQLSYARSVVYVEDFGSADPRDRNRISSLKDRNKLYFDMQYSF